MVIEKKSRKCLDAEKLFKKKCYKKKKIRKTVKTISRERQGKILIEL